MANSSKAPNPDLQEKSLLQASKGTLIVSIFFQIACELTHMQLHQAAMSAKKECAS